MLNAHTSLAAPHLRDHISDQGSPPIDGLLAELHRVVIEAQAESLESTKRAGLFHRLSVITLIAGWLATVLTSLGYSPQLAPWALLILVCGVVSTVILGAPSAIRSIREWRTLEADTIAAVGKNLARWHTAILHIRRTYTQDQLSFAKRYVSEVASQLRGRLAFIIGAFDKVGAIPLVGTTAFALANFNKGGTTYLWWCTAAAIAGLFYVIALRFAEVAFTFERFALILDHAAAKQG
ncbi:hypothetical protein LMG32289_06584 [Cupriavidus pampae]|uniref:ABC transporter ATP-binding protein n=1 Tax=Cupriavidus pampae TaxID=659251 RepID=A0ABM8Y1Y9_9BURK|nr:hypothetical protein LMG32289_06584 [Cupriavidus pampae]